VNEGRQIKVGCCGFVVAQKKYFSLFELIEIQQSFYQVPKIETAQKWRSAAPPGFEFTMKAWQLITHEPSSPTYRRLGEKIEPSRSGDYGRFQATSEVFDAWRRTAEFARTLGASIIVFQCPASFTATEDNTDNMRNFFNMIDRKDFICAWEPRGKWPEDVVGKLCEELGLIHCVDPFKNKPLHGEFQYFRLHGITGYDYSFTDEELASLVVWSENKPTYVLFNNTAMREDGLRFKWLIKKNHGRYG